MNPPNRREDEGAAAPRIGWYGDDFTGATDTLAEIARAGLRSLLFLDVPTRARLRRSGPLDAIGIAGAARGMAPADMTRALQPVGRFFAGIGVRIVHYKCCSTFDSAPGVGSIGAAVRELRRHTPNPLIPIVGGQPGIGRYCSFAQLFARAGSDPEIHRLDRHPVMSAHPVTPMREADLRRHLAAQGLDGVRSLPHTAYPRLRAAHDLAAADAWIGRVLAEMQGPVLLDLVDEEQLPLLGRLLWRAAEAAPLLAVGPSSVQQALARAGAGRAPASSSAMPPALPPARGPVLVVAGSLSPVTAQQIAACRRYERQPLDARRLAGDRAYAAAQADAAAQALAAGRHVLAYTLPPAERPAAGATAATARATAALLRNTLQASARAGLRLTRVGVAGGDTSSQAMLALRLWGLAFRAVLAPGVAVSTARGDDPLTDGLELMLKGGQMGGPSLFDELIDGGAG